MTNVVIAESALAACQERRPHLRLCSQVRPRQRGLLCAAGTRMPEEPDNGVQELGGGGRGGGGQQERQNGRPHPHPLSPIPWAARVHSHLKRREGEQEPQETKDPGQGPWRDSRVCLPFEPGV